MGRVLSFFRSGRGLSVYAATALGWMVLVILWGAVVRATGSGAGCGDNWPLCNGDFFPSHPALATVIEFTHRSMSGICTAFVAVLVGWTFLAHPRGAAVRKAAAWSGFLLVTEALLGAVLVLGGYVQHNASNARIVVQCVHFTNTMLLLAALTLAWWWQRLRPAIEIGRSRDRRLTWFGLACMVLTGATGSVAALADTLFPSANLRAAFAADLSASSPLLIRMRWIHPAASVSAIVLITMIAVGAKPIWRNTLLSLIGLQIVLGVADVLLLAPVWLQVLHLLGADLLWITFVSGVSGVLLPRRELAFRRATVDQAASLKPTPV